MVSGIWVQHEKFGMWLTGNNTNLQVTGNRILDTTADGININGTATGAVIQNNYIRNTGDDGLAMWSLNAADSGDSFLDNTVIQPNLANGIALYGGNNLTVRGNYVQDTNALGSGIAISNQAFLQPFFPLSGTITVDSNTIERAGAINPNWGHPMGAVRLDSYDYAISNTVNITNTVIKDSPYSAFEFVSGSGTGLPISNVSVNGATVTNAGTVVVQNETSGSATFSNITATGVGAAGVYNCPYPAGSGTFNAVDGGGNSGWSSTWNDCSTWPAPTAATPAAVAARATWPCTSRPPTAATRMSTWPPTRWTATRHLLGVHRQRPPGQPHRRPRLRAAGRAAGAQAPAELGLGRAHRDPLGPGQLRRLVVRHDRGLERLHLRPGVRQHRDRDPAGRHQHPLPAAGDHRQHRVAGRTDLGVRGVRVVTTDLRRAVVPAA